MTNARRGHCWRFLRARSDLLPAARLYRATPSRKNSTSPAVVSTGRHAQPGTSEIRPTAEISSARAPRNPFLHNALQLPPELCLRAIT